MTTPGLSESISRAILYDETILQQMRDGTPFAEAFAAAEVLMDGDHSLKRCFELTEQVLRTVFNQLYAQRVLVEGMILKPNTVLPGLAARANASRKGG